MKETITATDRVYEGRVVTLDIHNVTLPDGNTSVREVVQHPGAVAVVALDADQNVLLVRQYRIAADEVLLEIPAGTLNTGEDPQLCADRELQEETGFRAASFQAMGGIYTAPGYTSEYIHLFLATELSASVLPMDDDEFIEIETMPLWQALARIESGDIRDGKSVAGLLRAARILGV
jgi:ADP-ribose pyrophosphatase